ncbi:MAG: hypothetical protein DSZ03_06795 [Sulfurimonas sp.]|nr:MAG: hypothetical protein DSZ03_06795 [Sulfurimonas sp.]
MKTALFSLLAFALFFTGCTKQPECPPPAEHKAPPPPSKPIVHDSTPVLTQHKPIRITVVGQGVAPCTGSCSPEQALVLAKRAAIVDGYRLIAEKVKGVYVQGRDYVHNMMIKSSKVRTFVDANIRHANIIDTLYKDGLCEVEMEITLNYSQLSY